MRLSTSGQQCCSRVWCSDSSGMYLQRKKNSSDYVGVRLRGTRDNIPWYSALIKYNGKVKTIGCSFASKQAAARAYDRGLIAFNGRGALGVNRPGYNFSLDSYPSRVSCLPCISWKFIGRSISISPHIHPVIGRISQMASHCIKLRHMSLMLNLQLHLYAGPLKRWT